MNSIDTDLQFLCEELEDRQAQTEGEKRAAEYVTNRLDASVGNARRVDFDAIGNYRLMFAAYCGEFIVVNLLALWWPTVAFFYGLTIFLAYMAEIMGYAVFSRFLPPFESSSAVGLSEAHDASCVIVFTAYLDTDDNPFSRIEASLTRYYLHYLILLCMIFVLAACGIDALGAFNEQVNPYTHWMRWAGIAIFGILASAGLLRALAVRKNRGANNNASGIAALLYIADLLQEAPIANTTVLFYAAGSHYANMAGMRAMLSENPGMTENTYLINIESVGAGKLHFTQSEGIVHPLPCDATLTAIAKQQGAEYEATGVHIHSFRTNAYLPLMRGVPAISLLRLDETGLPTYFGIDRDICDNLSQDAVQDAALFALGIGREAARQHHSIPELEV